MEERFHHEWRGEDTLMGTDMIVICYIHAWNRIWIEKIENSTGAPHEYRHQEGYPHLLSPVWAHLFSVTIVSFYCSLNLSWSRFSQSLRELPRLEDDVWIHCAFDCLWVCPAFSRMHRLLTSEPWGHTTSASHQLYEQNKSLLHHYVSSLAKIKQSPREITEEPPLDQSASYELVLCFVYLMGLAVLGSCVLGRSCTTELHP